MDLAFFIYHFLLLSPLCVVNLPVMWRPMEVLIALLLGANDVSLIGMIHGPFIAVGFIKDYLVLRKICILFLYEYIRLFWPLQII